MKSVFVEAGMHFYLLSRKEGKRKGEKMEREGRRRI